jgi:hypothetical protein
MIFIFVNKIYDNYSYPTTTKDITNKLDQNLSSSSSSSSFNGKIMMDVEIMKSHFTNVIGMKNDDYEVKNAEIE